MKAILIAQVAHAINLAYCASLGDLSQSPWEAAPEWQQQSAMAGVEMHLANPDATPEQSHESWLAQKVAEGWVYGEVNDAEKKQHPCCVPYADLPQEQKAKDYILRAVVHALKDLSDGEEAEARINALTDQLAVAKLAAAPDSAVVAGGIAHIIGGVAVKYIGIKEDFKDRLYGTGLDWHQGQIRVLPSHLAKSFLRHADLFERCESGLATAESTGTSTADDTAQRLAEAEAKRQEDSRKELDLSAVHHNVEQMDKAALTEFGARYGVKIARNATEAKVSEARALIHTKIDQFGVV
ncbi:RyR domain-containing protein [Pseudomonas chengduensis]|nr:RyR domain-containing protein [Pseudomonas chengduensis]MDH1865732.1 RyR domain-containing protein [Pseudomonas chengduensis]